MGRQFRFYLLPSDANLLVEQLQKRFEAKLLLDYSPLSEVLEIDSPFRTDEMGDLGPMASRPRYYLAPPFGRIERHYYPKPDWWIIDSESEGIEFSGCISNQVAVAIGRFWYETNFVRDLQYVSKNTEFLKWAQDVYRFTKRSLHYDAQSDAYLGKDALSFREKGGQLARAIWPNGKVIPS